MSETAALILALVALAAALATAVARPPWAPEALVAAAGAAVLVAAGAIGWSDAGDALGDLAPDGRVPRRAAGPRRRLPPRRAVRRDRRAARRPRARGAAAAARARLPRRLGGDRGAEPRRDDRPAHAGRVRHRGAAAGLAAAARLRVRAPRQLGLAAAARLEPHQPARVPRQRALVPALRGADGAADARRDRGRVGSSSRASSRPTCDGRIASARRRRASRSRGCR